MMDSYIEKVVAFHSKYEKPISNTPVIPQDKDIDKQIRLMHTALAELCFAMKEDKMVHIARGLVCLLYYTFSTAIMYGIPIPAMFGEWHLSLMNGHPPREEKEILKRHGWGR